MLTTFLACLAVAFAVLIGIAVTRKPKPFRPDLDMLRMDIERAERGHKRRKQLRRQYVEGVRKELADG